MKGLKLEPGWRQACVTRLNLLRSKSNPPTIARTAPSCVLMATRAACTSGSCAIAQLAGLVSDDAHHATRRMRFARRQPIAERRRDQLQAVAA